MDLRKTGRELLSGLGDLFWPRSCFLCRTSLVGTESEGFCEKCRAELTAPSGLSCPRCSSTIGPHVDAEKGCLRCVGEKYHFQKAHRFGVYDGRLRDAILEIKKPGGESLSELLGKLFAVSKREELLDSKPTCIVPIPLHWRRWWERRYNQSAGIARGLSECLGIPLRARALIRIRDTPKQTLQTPAERRRNLIGAFRPSRLRNLRNERILLIDDVLTTGATAEAASAVLIAAGSAQVEVAVLAHR